MRAARPGRYEYEVEAALEKVYLESGARGWSYPSIVGSGPNATILHYSSSRRLMKDGDLLLIDAAANFEGLSLVGRIRIYRLHDEAVAIYFMGMPGVATADQILSDTVGMAFLDSFSYTPGSGEGIRPRPWEGH